MTSSRLLRITYQRLRLLARRRALESEIDREIAFHLEQLIDEKRSEGLSEETARSAARRAFGNVSAAIEQSREARGLTWIGTIRDDFGYGMRMLRRSPMFAAIASVALALGIGATAAVTGAMALVLVRPLPFSHGDQIVAIRTSRAEAVVPRGGALVAEYAAWRARSSALDAIGASLSGPHMIGADSRGAPADRVAGQAFTPSLFAMLGVQPEAGRLFDDVDQPFDRRALVVVISHRLWLSRFGGATDVLGRTMIVDGAKREIIGIMPAHFRFQSANVDLWIPLIMATERQTGGNGDAPMLIVIARLRAGFGIERARADLQAVASHVGSGVSIDVVPLRNAIFGWTVPRLATLAAGAGLTLILACANIAGLLLSRGRIRRSEMALRAALGATRARLVRQLLIESLLLGSIAALPALGITWVGLRLVANALGAPPGLPHPGVAAFDTVILGAIFGLAIVCPVAFGVGPALSLSGKGTAPVLRTARGAGSSPPLPRSWNALVGLQVAVASLLLITAALLAISFWRISRRELNFDRKGLITFDFSIPAGAFARPLGMERALPSFLISPTGAQTIHAVHDQLERIDGVVAAAGISFPPVNSLVLPVTSLRLVDNGGTSPAGDVRAAYFLVTPGLFAAFRTPVLGREFDSGDDLAAPWTAVINEALARLCCAGDNPIGRIVRLDNGADERPRRIIGVVKNIPTRLDQIDPQPIVYASFLQQPARYRGRAPGMFGGMTFVLRSARPDVEVVDAARRAVARLPPERPIVDVGTLQAHLDGGLIGRSAYTAEVSAFAIMSALLAILGIYGVTAYSVSTRSGEIAIRRALGAQTRDVLRSIGWPVAVTVIWSLAMGIMAAAAFAPLIGPQLWGVSATDPRALGAIAVVVIGGATGACALPLRHALTMDFATRLRTDEPLG